MENYTYMTLLTNNTYVQGVILLNETLKQVNSKYPLIVLVTNEVAQATLDILDYLQIKWKLIDNIPINAINLTEKITNDKFYYIINPFTKFQIFNQIEYKKIIFLDCDIMILKNIDHLFNKPHMTATLNGEYFQSKENIFNGGFLIIEPSINLFNELITFTYTNKNKLLQQNIRFNDQEILNAFYHNWLNMPELHLNKYYNVFSFHNLSYANFLDIFQNGFFVHFVGELKPWDYSSAKLFRNKQNIKRNYNFNSLFHEIAIYKIKSIINTLPPKLLFNFSKAYLKEIQS